MVARSPPHYTWHQNRHLERPNSCAQMRDFLCQVCEADSDSFVLALTICSLFRPGKSVFLYFATSDRVRSAYCMKLLCLLAPCSMYLTLDLQLEAKSMRFGRAERKSIVPRVTPLMFRYDLWSPLSLYTIKRQAGAGVQLESHWRALACRNYKPPMDIHRECVSDALLTSDRPTVGETW